MENALRRPQDLLSSADRIMRHSQLLSAQLQNLRQQMYPPEAMKSLRTFSSKDAAALLGVAESTLPDVAGW